jgi:hypothetical protein
MSTRTALIASGAVLTAVGGAFVTGGLVLGALSGTDGTFSTGQTHHATSANAVVSDEGDLGGSTNLAFGDPTLKVSVSDSDQPVFVGIGPAADVDRFLAGTTVQTVSDFDLWPLQLDTETREGTQQPGSPLDETFWVAQSDGATSAATSWKIDDGSYRVVVMNVDGSPGVDVDGSLSVRVPLLGAITVSSLVGGGLIVVVGVTLLVSGLRRKDETPEAPAPVARELTSVGA